MGCNCGSGTGGVNTADNSCTPCSCKGTPAPYYADGCAVQEPHCMPVVNQVFVTALLSGVDFVMPACSKVTVVNFPGLAVIQLGSYLWNAVYGYLVVTDFDPMTGNVTAMNKCTAGNAAPGTTIPRCTLFNVTDPP